MQNSLTAPERRMMMTVLLEPLLEPLQSAFGDYAGIAQQEFASALGRTAENADG